LSSLGVHDVIKLNSPLIEFSEGELLPDVISLKNWQLCNDATILTHEPLTVRMPKPQWSYGVLLPLTMQLRDQAQTICVRLELHVRSGQIGFAGVDRTLGTLTTAEKIITPDRLTATLTINNIAETAAVFLRTVSDNHQNPEVVLLEATAHRVGEARLAPRRHDLGYDLFVVLSPPKTATQTIEQTLLSMDARAQVRRIHLISSKAIQRGLTAVRSGLLPPAEVETQQLIATYSEGVRQEIELVRALGGRIAFISGKREPIDRIVSLLFQQIPTFIPAYALLHAAGSGFLTFLKEYAIYRIRGELELADEGCPSRTAGFYHDELIPIANIEVLQQSFDRERGFSLMTGTSTSALLYRYEGIGTTLASALSLLTGRTNIRIVNANISVGKEYAHLYNEFRASFKVPTELCSAIYHRDPDMQHFYSDAEIAAFKARWSE
jgi:Putative capsular polysaccharide synthesis protein